jgi:hypothetical protein
LPADRVRAGFDQALQRRAEKTDRTRGLGQQADYGTRQAGFSGTRLADNRDCLAGTD